MPPGPVEEPGAIQRQGREVQGRLRLHLENVRRHLVAGEQAAAEAAGSSPSITAEQAAAVVNARLGRDPQDALEASVVLEAWGGIRPGVALDLSAELFRQRQYERVAEVARSHLVRPHDLARQVSTLYGILLIAVWLPLFDPGIQAGRLAVWQAVLPLALGVQWGLRRRLRLDDPDGTVDGGWALVAVLGGLGFLAAGVIAGAPGVLGAALTTVWVVTTLLHRWRLLMVQTGVLLAAPVALHLAVSIGMVVAALSAVTYVVAFVALTDRAGLVHVRAAPWRTVRSAVIAGALFGLLVVLLPGVRDNADDPAVLIGFVPSLLGAVAGVIRMEAIWRELPQVLRTARAVEGPDPDIRRLVRHLCGSALLWYLLVAVAGTALLWAFGPDDGVLGLYGRFLALGLLTLVAGVLEAFRHPGWSVVAIAVPVVVLVVAPHPVGAAIGLGSGIGVAGAVLAGVLRRPAFVLAKPL